MLSLIVTLFVIGLIVMIFVIMGSKLQDTTGEQDTSATAVNESGYLNHTGYTLKMAGLRGFASPTIVTIINTTGGTVLTSTNWTFASNILKNATAKEYSTVKVTYTYTYTANNTATDVMADTTHSVAGVTDWFDIFIVIGAMVVLILLVVIIITAIRGSGLVTEAGQQRNSVGTA